MVKLEQIVQMIEFSAGGKFNAEFEPKSGRTVFDGNQQKPKER